MSFHTVEYFLPEQQKYVPCTIEDKHSLTVYVIRYLDVDSGNTVVRMAFKKELRFNPLP